MKPRIQGRNESEALTGYIDLLTLERFDEQSTEMLLDAIGNYYQADRVCIFEYNEGRTQAECSYEWDAEGKAPTVERHKRIPTAIMDLWVESFREYGSFFLANDPDFADEDPLIGAVLEPLGIECLLAVPLTLEGKISGFLYVENPGRNQDQKLFLSLVAVSMYKEVLHRREREAHSNMLRMMEEANRAKEAALLESEIVSSISKMYFAIIRIDLQYNFYQEISADRAMHRLTGHEGNAQAKMDEICKRIVDPEYYDEVYRFFDLETVPERLKEIDTVEVQYRATDGNWHEARFIAKKRDESGTATSVLYATRLLSSIRQKELEQQRALKDAFAAADQANRAKTSFLNSMSHDIRTPLNGILGMAAIAGAHMDDPARVRECLAKINGAGSHLLGLINEVLDVSRIESGKVDLQEAPFSIPELMENMVGIVTTLAKGKGQRLKVTVGQVRHEDVIGDSTRLQQVFLNIIGNAVKYTPAGGNISVMLDERASTSFDYAEYVLICEDNGIGMTKAFLEKLFVPFERAEDEEVRGTQGTGLGMVITRNIVHMMDGDIRVRSEYRKGSRFEVTFRLKIQSKDHRVCPELRDVPVMVIDDDPVLGENARELLTEIGMQVERCSSGEAAIERIEREGTQAYYRVFLVADSQSGAPATEIAQQLRKIVPEQTAILMIASTDTADMYMQARASGIDDCIPRPLFRSRLQAKLTAMLAKRDVPQNQNDIARFEEADFGDRTILLAEDNELNREIAVEIVGMTGAKVECAEDGAQAVRMFETSAIGYYDMILMDIQMPIMDGCSATRAIRELDRSDAASVPIIAVSANAFVEDMKSSTSAGMNEHLAKPLDLRKLLSVMERYFGARRKDVRSEECSSGKQKEYLPAKYYENLYLTNGETVVTYETEAACVEVLRNSGAVGIIGLYEQKDYPLYCVSEYALEILGYSFKALLEETKGSIFELIHPDDRSQLSEEFYGAGIKHYFRIRNSSGQYIYVTSYSTDVRVMDGSGVRMLSLRAVPGKIISEIEHPEYTNWKERLLSALTGSVLYMFEIDLTTGLVGADIVADNGTNYTQVLGIQAPCRFDDMIRNSKVEGMKCSDPSITGLDSLNCANLSAAYRRGDTCTEIEFYYVPDRQYHRISYYLTEDAEASHVMALAVCRDITKLKSNSGECRI